MQKLILTEEEQMVRESAADFLSQKRVLALCGKSGIPANPQGFSSEVWLEMAELGWPSILIQEEQVDSVLVTSRWVRSWSCVAAHSLVRHCSRRRLWAHLCCLGGDRLALLPKVAAGSLTLALAIDEAPRHNPSTQAWRRLHTERGKDVCRRWQRCGLSDCLCASGRRS